MRSLTAYREMYESLKGGTVPVERVLEILDVAQTEVQRAHGEHTLTRAIEISGRSRTWFKRRLRLWGEQGQARQLDNGTWLIRDDVVPRVRATAGGVDLSKTDDELFAQIFRPATAA